MGVRKKIHAHFFTQWTSDMAYVLGFLFADGNITRTKRGGYYIAFHSADRALLASIRSKMGSAHKLSKRSARSGNVYRFQIGSKKMYQDVCVLGLTPHKASRMKFPAVPPEFLKDFVRGYFDGDGNVWVGNMHRERKKRVMSLQVSFTSASHAFLDFLLHNLRSVGLTGGSLFRLKSKNASRLTFASRDAVKLSSFMYNAPCKLYLPRKKKVFERFAKMRE